MSLCCLDCRNVSNIPYDEKRSQFCAWKAFSIINSFTATSLFMAAAAVTGPVAFVVLVVLGSLFLISGLASLFGRVLPLKHSFEEDFFLRQFK